MPLARIDLLEGKPESYRRAIGEVVYDAVVQVMKAPDGDRFQVITEHKPGSLVFDPHYAGIERSDDCVFIQVTLSEGRTVEQKQEFYRFIADELHARIGLRREDTVINLIEVNKANWSFGNGIAQYV